MNTVTVITVVGFLMFFTIGTAFIITSDTNEGNDLDVNIIARANINGSGIFSNVELSIDPQTQAEKDKWGGLVFMTPGPASIQHFMLNRFVKEELGKNFVMYTPGGDNSKDTVYWTQVAPNLMMQTYLKENHINGGFPWDPFFTDIRLTVGGIYCISSDLIEHNHPCCMVAAKESFLTSNEGAVLRFLSAYTESLDWVNAALAEPLSANYATLLEITRDFTGITNNAVLTAAFNSLTYMYDLNDPTSPYTLEEYTADLIVSFESLGVITKHVDDPVAFGNSFINHKCIDKIIADGRTETYPSKMIKVRIGHLVGDIHQIGLVVGMKLGIFEKYGVELITIQCANGPEVMRLFQLGVIDIGILGLPPAVSNTANFR